LTARPWRELSRLTNLDRSSPNRLDGCYVPIMNQQRSGKIITVGSVAGTAPSVDGGYAHYRSRNPQSRDMRPMRSISISTVSPSYNAPSPS
jgi:hypothetical protein